MCIYERTILFVCVAGAAVNRTLESAVHRFPANLDYWHFLLLLRGSLRGQSVQSEAAKVAFSLMLGDTLGGGSGTNETRRNRKGASEKKP